MVGAKYTQKYVQGRICRGFCPNFVYIRKEIVTMKVYGYCRISTSRQSMERQIRNIKLAYPDAVIVKETYTGMKRI